MRTMTGDWEGKESWSCFYQGTSSKMMQKRVDFGKWKRRILQNIFFRALLPLLYELGKFYEHLA